MPPPTGDAGRAWVAEAFSIETTVQEQRESVEAMCRLGWPRKLALDMAVLIRFRNGLMEAPSASAYVQSILEAMQSIQAGTEVR